MPRFTRRAAKLEANHRRAFHLRTVAARRRGFVSLALKLINFMAPPAPPTSNSGVIGSKVAIVPSCARKPSVPAMSRFARVRHPYHQACASVTRKRAECRMLFLARSIGNKNAIGRAGQRAAENEHCIELLCRWSDLRMSERRHVQPLNW